MKKMRFAHELSLLMNGLTLVLALFSSAVHASSVEEQRQENLRRMLQMKNGTALAAPKAPSSIYVMQIALAVKKNIHLDTEIEGNPEAVVQIETELDGRIRSHSLVQSSGVVEWDRAVLEAVVRTERLPIESTETLPKLILFHFRPK